MTKCKFSSPEVMCDSVKRIFMIDLECSKINFIPLFVVPAGKNVVSLQRCIALGWLSWKWSEFFSMLLKIETLERKLQLG